jgi:hypothetical protein
MTDTETLDKLRSDWKDRWHIWRSVGSRKIPGGYKKVLGDWCATRLDESAGLDLTVMCNTAVALEAALHDQADRVANGGESLTIATDFGG